MSSDQVPAAAQAAKAAPAAKAVKPGHIVVQYGEVRDIPLNRLKASPHNVRRVGHSAQVIESRAASITYKGVLQPLVVEPEIKDGRETGYFLVSAGEGRRQALRLLAQRKRLAKGAAVRCIVDTVNDPAEVSMDENLSRESMHPADQYEAFKDLAARKGYSAEELSARFGPSPETVRKHLRLGAVAPALLDLYREGALTLDQVTAFAVNPDPERQMQVYAQLSPGVRQPYAIRRAMTELKVAPDDRRVRFLGLDAYVAAGGPVLRDLFTEDNEGWVEDVVLLDRLVAEKLAAMAQGVRDREGWKWASAHLEVPHGHGLGRIFDHELPRTPEEVAAVNALEVEEAALIDQWADVEPPPPEVAARLEAIDAEREALGDGWGYAPEEKARAGVMVVLLPYGDVRIDRGFVRPEDEPAPAIAPEEEDEGEGDAGSGAPGADRDDGFLDDEADDDDGAGQGNVGVGAADEDDEPVGDPAAPLPDRVIAELTAHRTAAMRDAVAENPDLAQLALVHALVASVFGVGDKASCLDIRWGSRNLSTFGEGIEDSPAGVAVAARHHGWARQMPKSPEDFWDFVVGLDGDSRALLLAHCVSLTVDGVRSWERRPRSVLAHVERLATAADLDMRGYWKPTAARYLNRVTKAQIMAAVSDGVSGEMAARLSGLKKPDMVEAAEPLLVQARWLPTVLRTVLAPAAEPEPDPAAPGVSADGVAAEAGGEEDAPDVDEASALFTPETAALDQDPPLIDLGEVLNAELEPTQPDAADVEALASVAA